MYARRCLATALALFGLVMTGCVTLTGTEHNARTIVAFGDLQAAGGFTGETTPEKQAVLRHEAQLAYLQAIKVEPKYLPAYLGLARLQKANRDYVAAIGTYQQALQLEDRNAGLWNEVGNLYCKMQQWDAGIDCLRKAVAFDPGNTGYRSTLGYWLVMAGNPDEGFDVLAQTSGEAKAHLDMARLRAHQGQTEQSKLHLAEAQRLNPNLTGLTGSTVMESGAYQRPGDGAAQIGTMTQPARLAETSGSEDRGDDTPRSPGSEPPVLSIRSARK